ncbi:hypothetical protein AB837_00542 [bacterium AB1]|nr:hypothetical protein AB837_00542 [bacterium AB1]
MPTQSQSLIFQLAQSIEAHYEKEIDEQDDIQIVIYVQEFNKALEQNILNFDLSQCSSLNINEKQSRINELIENVETQLNLILSGNSPLSTYKTLLQELHEFKIKPEYSLIEISEIFDDYTDKLKGMKYDCAYLKSTAVKLREKSNIVVDSIKLLNQNSQMPTLIRFSQSMCNLLSEMDIVIKKIEEIKTSKIEEIKHVGQNNNLFGL